MQLTYLPLQGLRERYTEFLSVPDGWAERAFRAKFEKLVSLRPAGHDPLVNIVTGKVLDRVNRPIWAMQQIIDLLKLGGDPGKVYFDDFFHPGIESLAYSGLRFQAYSFCWAQTFDVFDFTNGMISWMRPYEIMGFAIKRKVFVACDELKEYIRVCSPEWGGMVDVVGLPFNSDDVAKKRDPAYECDKYDLVYSSRFDREKNPSFFLDLVANTGVKAAICTGQKELNGDDAQAVARAKEMSERGQLDIHQGLTKGQYYSVLDRSHVQFNCSLQDWISYTLLEALTYGCVPLYPNFRAMPNALEHSEENLYRPFDLSSASAKLKALLMRGRKFPLADPILQRHDAALKYIAQTIYTD